MQTSGDITSFKKPSFCSIFLSSSFQNTLLECLSQRRFKSGSCLWNIRSSRIQHYTEVLYLKSTTVLHKCSSFMNDGSLFCLWSHSVHRLRVCQKPDQKREMVNSRTHPSLRHQ